MIPIFKKKNRQLHPTKLDKNVKKKHKSRILEKQVSTKKIVFILQ